MNDVSNDERFPLFSEYEHAWGNREYMVGDVTARTKAQHSHDDLQKREEIRMSFVQTYGRIINVR